MVLSDAAQAASIVPDAVDAEGFAGAAVSYSLHAQSFRDAIRAVSITYGRSAALTPSTLARLVSGLSLELRGDPSMLAAMTLVAPASVKNRLESIPAYTAIIAEVTTAQAMKAGSGAKSIVSGQEFITMRAGNAVIKAGPSLAAIVSVDQFRLASSETTVGQFERFIKDHPEWAPQSIATLVAKGLADDDYLKGFAESSAAEVLAHVSRPAAMAYCDWMNKNAPPGFRFSLPTEAQWSMAAATSNASAGKQALFSDLGATGPLNPDALPADSAGFRGLLGNVWEWCTDSYASNPASGQFGRARFSSAESVVRGGSWANRSDLVSLDSRGPMRESDCSAYVGFRIALVAETDQ
jgi:formylglycine-generating enzyme required for sulfatase activity